ncbi:transformer-2 protein homolog alpha-like [Chironomus tepperi]|uniref:transformer-2 protein homolog alpha-like n=1 Tax=Chironomus tepperi TaxID=113505 RepID=UPI00391F2E33
MVHEVKHENQEEYDENNDSNSSSRKRHNDSISDKRSSSRERSRKRSRRERSYSSSRSRSPDNYKRIRYHGSRENPNKSRVLGVFGLNSRTLEDDLADIFSRYGAIQDIRIVYDAKSGNSRGFGFIYFDYVDDATKARRECNGMYLNGKRIRVDYSITKRAHTPTPGIYMGIRQSKRDDRMKHRSHSSYRRYSRRSHRRSRSYSR